MNKPARQEALLRIISAEPLKSQMEVAGRLKALGFEVTQASVSRDIEELGVVKAGGRYTLPARPQGAKLFGLREIEAAGDALVVAKCDPGLASAAAVRIDSARLPQIAGTIAGDDTIFIAVREAKDQRRVIKAIWELFDKQGI
jgi:transcriptional regulator of arginine metabolism